MRLTALWRQGLPRGSRADRDLCAGVVSAHRGHWPGRLRLLAQAVLAPLVSPAGVAAAAAVVAGAVLSAAPTTAQAQTSFEQVRAAHRPSDIMLLDRHGQPLHSLRTDPQRRTLAWVPLDQLSPALLQAVVLSEDKQFWQHSGVDWGAVAASAWGNLVNQRTRGASTLTMQLAGLIDEGLARPAGGRQISQKLDQALMARRLEATWRKHQILEAYLNSVPFRGELVGIHALSHTLFGKHPGGLDALEAAITAALLRAPNAPHERVGERACGVLRSMGQGCDGVRTLAATALLRRPGPPPGEQLAPHAARWALRPDGPAEQRSTLDATLQRLAVQTLKRQLAELQGRNVEDGAVLVLDNASGQVLAWVGANAGSSAAPQVDGVLARRQPGSTLKPFVYSLALERRLITAASLLDDSPAQIGTAAGLYTPQNYDRAFRGRVSARAALGGSLNVPAVRVAALLPPDALHARLNNLGLGLKQPAGWYGAALALGGADVSLLALTNAYRAMANGGLYGPVAMGAQSGPSHTGPPVSPGAHTESPRSAAAPAATASTQRVIDAAASFIITDMLADNNARATTFGLDSVLRSRGFAAVKTGTSKDLRDNWCIGFTDRYTVGVWVGNASGAAMHGVSGISGAAPVWAALVQHLHQGQPSLPPLPPPGVQQAAVAFADAGEPPRDEWFVAGTQPPKDAAIQARGRTPGITSPADGSLFALDPDMPPQHQRIVLEGEGGSWWLNGRRLGQGVRLAWALQPGRHTLQLRDGQGRVIQQIGFEVRGLLATGRQAAQCRRCAPGSATL